MATGKYTYIGVTTYHLCFSNYKITSNSHLTLLFSKHLNIFEFPISKLHFYKQEMQK